MQQGGLAEYSVPIRDRRHSNRVHNAEVKVHMKKDYRR